MLITKRCSHCQGSGRIEVTGIYADTFQILRQQPTWIHGAALAAIAGCKGPAMNNRLAALEKLGLAVSKPYGRMKLYRAKA